MIYDNIKNCSLYLQNEKFKRAFDFLNGYKGGLPICKIDLCEGAFALIQKYNTKEKSMGKWESHNEYIDLQYVFKGQESFGIANIERLNIAVPYSKEKECALYTGQGDFITMRAGDFAIVYPHDGHMPQIGDGREVEKIVVKIKI